MQIQTWHLISSFHKTNLLLTYNNLWAMATTKTHANARIPKP